jgi:hypothetical protein
MPRDVHIVDAVLGALSPDEQLASLICCIVERRPQAVRGLVSMTAVITLMAQYLSIENKIALSEVLRDAADTIEHQKQLVHIN